ncbi:hypothetical protein KY49_3298 [Burkholderia sp. MSHR3999]|uniref:hypothetical protein n=1 Tax=Burkholderia sp. MSHR3999 TaxID=1542965 RepID=UPI0005ACE477|nr:hypothetical protein [Burkholderia sp. MSHR3999]KIP19338.1 hypothetical protein KY49_3298 [Burkholderia sp. MSHR3999]
MPAATADRNTEMREGRIVSVLVAGGSLIHAGVLVAVNANGLAVEGKTEADLTYIGRAEQYVDNTTGADGAVSVQVRRGVTFKWANAADDAVTQASYGKPCFIEDNQTVAKTNGNGTRSPAGIVLGVDADGVWVL